ncbi:Uma2 family endonuclease [Nocardiopsis suaedae]|uniref:Uma2 family endonuclease n=1 Tax=Nocardiopsis suaedae TaxID=3018444 RepID=A0ABT4TLM9_9ACTN|nr:Uma2 family endonuclease [Nocardiopsis suaedae]MDA2805597.1 Uma2 family endonuclease [Nocardiopsis suaedae]
MGSALIEQKPEEQKAEKKSPRTTTPRAKAPEPSEPPESPQTQEAQEAVEAPSPTPSRAESRWELLLRTWQEIDMPDGWRAEIREAGIVLVPPPAPAHNDIAALISAQLHDVLPRHIAVHQGTPVAIPDQERMRAPDLMAFPRSALPQRRGEGVDPAEVLLVVEIASKSNADDDRTAKRYEYAGAGVPLYLLIDGYDKRGSSISLFSTPRDGDYDARTTVEWGKPIELPEPFACSLESSEFRVPLD